MKQILIFLFGLILFEKVFSQEIQKGEHAYAIWISRYENGWIDSENSLWLCERKGLNVGLTKASLNPISLVVRDTDIMKDCCSDKSFKENDFKNGDENLWEEVDLFTQKETLKLKYGNFKIKVLAVKQVNCKCSSEYVVEYSKVNPAITFAMILNYQPFKLTRKEKNIFKKNKKILIEYLMN